QPVCERPTRLLPRVSGSSALLLVARSDNVATARHAARLAEMTPARGDDEKHAGDGESDSRNDRPCSCHLEQRDLGSGQPDASEENEQEADLGQCSARLRRHQRPIVARRHRVSAPDRHDRECRHPAAPASAGRRAEQQRGERLPDCCFSFRQDVVSLIWSRSGGFHARWDPATSAYDSLVSVRVSAPAVPRSLVWATDLDVLPVDRVVEGRDGYLVIRSPSNPMHYWGNLLLFDTPPVAGDGARWEERFDREFGSDSRLQHLTFGWGHVA